MRMKTKLFSLLLAIAVSVGTMFAEKVQIGNLYYNLKEDQTAEVTYDKYFNENNYKSLTTADIPASVTYSGTTYSVTSIGEYAFYKCSSLTSVTIPNSVTSIGNSAFSGCSSLTSVTIPNSVTSIGGEAFAYCSGLTSVTIPNSVTNIGDHAFYSCRSLTSPVYNAHVFAYMPKSYSGAYTIPDGIASIADYAFEDCSSLTSVTIPNSVTSIGKRAFSGCSSLTSVTIPNSVTSIGYETFAYCSSLTSVTIPNSVTSIGVRAFENCTSLETLSLGENVSQYGEKAFAGCPNIVSIFNYRPRPSKLGTDVFKDVDYFECTLYVLAGSVDMYKSSGSDWKDFFFIEPIGAESIITEDVKVTPHDNTVDIIWPSVNEANTYEIEITKDGEAFCRLIFNAQGQLTSIAFAPSRANVAQQTQATGFSFTVIGLTSGTKYGYTIAASNSASQIIDTKQGSFTTTGGIAAAVDNTNVETKPIKVIRDGQLFILRDGNTYTVQGQLVK